jgi:hypothetical protein
VKLDGTEHAPSASASASEPSPNMRQRSNKWNGCFARIANFDSLAHHRRAWVPGYTTAKRYKLAKRSAPVLCELALVCSMTPFELQT